MTSHPSLNAKSPEKERDLRKMSATRSTEKSAVTDYKNKITKTIK